MANKTRGNSSLLETNSFSKTISLLKDEICELYLEDEIPWVIGYSGGKDSTAIAQLIWYAISELPLPKRSKTIHVISTDTLVENPVVALWVNQSLEKMRKASSTQNMPIVPHRLTPKTCDTFWVHLIGKGYPAPRNKFRWCTERMKIFPSHNFICDVVRKNGEAILALGTRKAESSARARNMAQYEKRAVRDRLTPNSRLLNCLIYTPIEDWSNDDVWMYLMRIKNPWENNNKDLLTMYRGATAGGECPLVVDTNTPSCGKSRFGCWVCTLVEEDKSMAAMIQNDEEKEWMLPLLEFRNELDFYGPDARKRDRSRRDFRRLTGQLSYYTDRDGKFQLVHGPYKQETRVYFLRRLLQTQELLRKLGPELVKDIDLITIEELQEIRRIWIVEKHEIEDLLVRIYEEEVGEPYPCATVEDNLVFGADSLSILRKLCGNEELHYELTRNLLDIEQRFRAMISRHGLFKEIEAEIKRCFYDDEEDALDRATKKSLVKNARAVSADHREVNLLNIKEIAYQRRISRNNSCSVENTKQSGCTGNLDK